MPTDVIVWQNLTNAVINGDGDLEKDSGSDNCFTNASGTGDAGARSTQIITSGDWEFKCTLGPIAGESGRSFVGIQDGTFSLDFADWQYAIHISTEENTSGTPHPANSLFIYQGAAPNKTYRDGIWTNTGQDLRLVCINGVVRAYLDTLLIYTFANAPTYPLYAVASLACLDKTVIDPVFITGTGVGAEGCIPIEGVIVPEEDPPPSEVTTDVTFECPTFFDVTGNSAEQNGGVDGHKVAWVQSDELINTEGDSFSWFVPNVGAEMYIGTATYNCPSCTPVNLPDPLPDYCYFPEPYFQFYYTLDENEWGVYEGGVFVTNGTYTATSEFSIRRNGAGKAEWSVDGIVVATSTATMASNHRLIAVGGTLRSIPSSAYPAISEATYTTGSAAPTEFAVDWDEANFFNAALVDTTITRSTTFANNYQVYAQTTTTIANEGEAFEWTMPIPTTPGGVTIGLRETGETVDCGDNSVNHPTCGWDEFKYFWFNHHTTTSVLINSYLGWGAIRTVAADTVYQIRICNGAYDFLLDGVVQFQWTGMPLMSAARLVVWVDYGPAQESSIGDLITDARKITDIDCDSSSGGVTGDSDTSFGDGDPDGEACAFPWTFPTPGAFPLPAQGGPVPVYFDEIEPDWGEHSQTFGDGFQASNTIQSAQIRRFAVEWDGLDEEQAAIVDAHWNSTRGALSFSITHPYTAEVINGVRYENYRRTSHRRVWSQQRSATLVKYTS